MSPVWVAGTPPLEPSSAPPPPLGLQEQGAGMEAEPRVKPKRSVADVGISTPRLMAQPERFLREGGQLGGAGLPASLFLSAPEHPWVSPSPLTRSLPASQPLSLQPQEGKP